MFKWQGAWWRPSDLEARRPAVQTYEPGQGNDWRAAQRESWRQAIAAAREYKPGV